MTSEQSHHVSGLTKYNPEFITVLWIKIIFY